MYKIKTRGEIPSLIKLPFGQKRKRMVELGVARGMFSGEILGNHSDIHLTMVDRWAGDRGHNDEEMEVARKRVSRFPGRHKLVKAAFEHFVASVPDGYFDIIYIDGYAHTGQEKGETLRLWYSKLRTGGVFSGHDYHPQWPKTMAAVDAFMEFIYQKHGQAPEVRYTENDEYPSWYFIKP